LRCSVVLYSASARRGGGGRGHSGENLTFESGSTQGQPRLSIANAEYQASHSIQSPIMPGRIHMHIPAQLLLIVLAMSWVTLIALWVRP
jgi:hypothetical protein